MPFLIPFCTNTSQTTTTLTTNNITLKHHHHHDTEQDFIFTTTAGTGTSYAMQEAMVCGHPSGTGTWRDITGFSLSFSFAFLVNISPMEIAFDSIPVRSDFSLAGSLAGERSIGT
jgi:hypothetical protein